MEYNKAAYDREQLEQSLQMAHSNSVMKLLTNKEALAAQKENMILAEDVYSITEKNFDLGLDSLSDVLNASSEMIKAQTNYVESLLNFVLSYLELKKSEGTIKEIIK